MLTTSELHKKYLPHIFGINNVYIKFKKNWTLLFGFVFWTKLLGKLSHHCSSIWMYRFVLGSLLFHTVCNVCFRWKIPVRNEVVFLVKPVPSEPELRDQVWIARQLGVGPNPSGSFSITTRQLLMISPTI